MTEIEPGLTPNAAQALLGDIFAPWVQELNLQVDDITPETARVRMPFDARLCRVGGMICGQALLTGADTTYFSRILVSPSSATVISRLPRVAETKCTATGCGTKP